MIQRKGILIIAIAVLFILGVVWWFLRSSPKPMAQTSPSPSQVSQVGPAGAPSPDSPTPRPLLVDNVTGKTMSQAEALQSYVDRFSKDPVWEGKVPLSFYGKVVDENKQPVAGASVHLQWNTTRELGGTAYAEASSDAAGLFTLTGQQGKNLEVSVKKDGYYSVDRGGSYLSFEYANPSSPDYYVPDANSPVVFHLRKKREGAKLVNREIIIRPNAHHIDTGVSVLQGSVQPNGTLHITSDTSAHLPGAQPFPWTVSLTTSEGGLAETDDQFPFLAPASGYVPSETIAMTNLDRAVWRGDVTRTFYFYLPSNNVYGRITVNASSSLPLTLNYSYNPTPGDRNLEPASQDFEQIISP